MIISVYADGGQILASPSPYGGSWAWVAVDVDDEVLAEDAGLLLPHHLDVKRITNNDSELYALVRALEACPDGADVSAYSDSQCTLMRMARIARGQAPTKTMNQELYDRAEAALSRLGEVCFVHVKGHPTRSDLERGRTSKGRLVSRHQVRCDDLCTEKAQEYMDTLSTSPTLMGRR